MKNPNRDLQAWLRRCRKVLVLVGITGLVRHRMAQLSASAVLIAALTTLLGCGVGGSAKNDAVAMEDAEFRIFVERFFNAPPPQSETTSQILLRALPTDTDAPTPKAATVAGSVVSSRYGERIAVRTILDVPGAALDEAESLFVDAYEAAGWVARELPSPGGGLAATADGHRGVTLLFCSNEGRWAQLDLSAIEPASGVGAATASVDARLVAVEPNGALHPVCEESGSRIAPRQPDIFPRLEPPLGAEPRPRRFILRSTATAFSDRTFATGLPVDRFHEHYSSLLHLEDWRRIEMSAETGMIWSLWRFTDQKGREWVGTLTVVERTESTDTPGESGQEVILEAIPLGHSLMPTVPPSDPT